MSKVNEERQMETEEDKKHRIMATVNYSVGNIKSLASIGLDELLTNVDDKDSDDNHDRYMALFEAISRIASDILELTEQE